MIRWLPVLVVAVALPLALAGCLGEPSDTPEDELPKPGAVEGRVLGETGEAIPQADVSLVASDMATVTGEDGSFEITGIQPGPLTLVASKPGHSTQTLKDHLEEGEQLQLEFRLIDAPSLDPYHTTILFRGSIQCGLPAGVECPGVEQDPNEHWFRVDPGLQGILYEMTWESPTEGVDQSLRLEAAAASGHACGETYDAVTGQPVLGLHLEEGFPIAGGHQCARVWPAEDPMFEQTYEVYVTLFYHEPMPEGFTAIN